MQTNIPDLLIVEEGVSTYVYRIQYANEIFHLRVLPEIGASFASVVIVHQNLRVVKVSPLLKEQPLFVDATNNVLDLRFLEGNVAQPITCSQPGYKFMSKSPFLSV